MSIEIKISTEDRDYISTAMAEKAVELISETFNTRSVVETLVRTTIETEVRGHVGEVVNKMLTEGWETTDGYGQVTGHSTIKSAVLQALDGNRWQDPIKRTVGSEVPKQVKAILAERSKEITDSLDGAVMQEIRKAIVRKLT